MFGSELGRGKLNPCHYFEVLHSCHSHIPNTSLIPPSKRIIFVRYTTDDQGQIRAFAQQIEDFNHTHFQGC